MYLCTYFFLVGLWLYRDFFGLFDNDTVRNSWDHPEPPLTPICIENLWVCGENRVKWSLNFTIHNHKPTGMSPGDTFFKTFARSEFLSEFLVRWHYFGLNNMWNPRKLLNSVTTGQKLSKSVKIWTLMDWKVDIKKLKVSWTNSKSTFDRISVNIWSSEPNQDSIFIYRTFRAQRECF